MRNNNNPLFRLLNKVNSLVILVLLLLLSVVIDGAIIYGISNSSLVNNEIQVRDLQKETGSMFRLAYNLENETEASRLSLINPISDFNTYRSKELGRNVSYVLNKWYEATYEDKKLVNYYVCYDDNFTANYDDCYTCNRFQIKTGSFKDLDNDNYVYLSKGFVDSIGDISLEDVVGKHIKLSLDEEVDFVIGGVIDDNNYNDSGIHFGKLYSPSYIMLSTKTLYKYGYNNLLFASNDAYYSTDLLDFINAYNKSYLKHDNASVRISTYKDDMHTVNEVSFKQDKNGVNKFYSVTSIIVLAISTLTFISIILLYDFNKAKLYFRIPTAILLFGYQFLSVLFIVTKFKEGLFIPNLSIVLFISFLVISLIAYIYAFSFFHYESKNKNEEITNG